MTSLGASQPRATRDQTRIQRSLALQRVIANVTTSEPNAVIQPDPTATGLPVTILTGFLGAGKTTLLNHILSNQQGVKTAVLVNEFGEIGIDNDLIIATGEDMVELSNGCICCSINGELLEAVYRILERPEPVDYLVVETTGLADPLPVAMTFLGSDLRDQTRLDSIITLIDAENFSDEILRHPAAQQVRPGEPTAPGGGGGAPAGDQDRRPDPALREGGGEPALAVERWAVRKRQGGRPTRPRGLRP